MYDLYVKQEIFNMFDLTRVLFNDYYNGHNDSYTDIEIDKIRNIINSIENNCKEIKEEINRK